MTLSQRFDVEYYCWLHNWSTFEEAWEEFCRMTMDDYRYKEMHNVHWCLIRGTYNDFIVWLKNSGYCED